MELVLGLFRDHRQTFEAMFEILATSDDEAADIPALRAVVEKQRQRLRMRIAVCADGEQIEGFSVGDFMQRAVEYLDGRGLLAATVPFPTSDRRYLVAHSPHHQEGNRFFNGLEFSALDGHTYWLETNASRDAAVKSVRRLLQQAGCEVSTERRSSSDKETL